MVLAVMKHLIRSGLALLIALAATTAPAASDDTRQACVFDPVGADGFVYELRVGRTLEVTVFHVAIIRDQATVNTARNDRF